MIHPTTRPKSPRGFLRQALACGLLGLGAFSPFASSMAHAQYAEWTANPPNILPNERPGAGAVWIVGSGRQVPNRNAFAALESDGSITAWGGGSSGAPTDSGYTAIYSNGSAFAALKANGSITAWGDPNKGGSGAPTDSGYTDIYSTLASFIAKKADGSITAWGQSDFGVSDAPTDDGYRSIYTNQGSCVALTATGGIKGWGRQDLGNQNVPTDEGYTAISSTQAAFAALKADGSITSWGHPLQGGSGAPEGSNYTGIYANQTAFAALKNDKTIKAWGGWATGGTTGAPTDAGYIGIYCNVYAFAALKEGGSIYVWGNEISGGSGAPTDSGYITISSTREAFAALKADGSITAWGNADYGGSGAPTDAGYVAIYSNAFAFAALKNDGSVRAWGYTGFGGSDAPTDNGYTSIYSNERAFAALKADGSITAWGQADYGVSDAPTDTGFSRIQAVFPNPAFVFTPQLTVTLGSITASSAAVGVAVSTMMDKTAGARGLVYAIASSNADPLIGGASVTQLVETPLGVEPTFNFELSGLSGNTAYTCKAYVTDTEGVTYYSPVATFSTNLPPLIISDGAASTAAVSVTENSSAVTTVSATDADAGQAISYSVTGGTDAARFVVDSSSGALTFVAAPDFEAPEDADADNVYQVVVTATDNGNTPKSATQTVDITVTNVADNGELVLERADGTGLASGDVADFGSQTLGQPVDLTFTLRSVGEADLVLPDGMTFGGASASAFSLVGSFPETVATGSSITFTVRFSPMAGGSNTADLSFATNDTRPGRTSYVLNLRGTGLTSSTLGTYATAANQVRGGWINGTDFTLGAVTTNWPSGESPDKAVDNNTGTKFLAFRNNNAGLILSPTNATLAFNRLSLYTANDASERDPASYVIYGSSTVLTGTSGTNLPLTGLTKLASGTITLPDNRSSGPTVVQFANTTAYASYIVAFPTVRSTSGNSITQISEVQLSQGMIPPYAVAMTGARGGELSGSTFNFGNIGTTNPGNNWPGFESPDHALDGNVNTKFLFYRPANGGIVCSPVAGPAAVNRFTVWTANDAPERDPIKYQVYGFVTRVTQTSGSLNVGTAGTLLDSGNFTLPDARNAGPVTVEFSNSTAYASYLVVFPAVKYVPITSMTQISELQFAYNGVPDFALPVGVTTPVGETWTARESIRQWTSICSSVDGTKLAALDQGALNQGGKIYISSDSGATWTARENDREWQSIASSADGMKLAAVAWNDRIYTSTDFGVTWTPRESTRYWISIASSADGTKLAAAEQWGRIYTSSDSGATWTPRESSRQWVSICSSADGVKLAAVDAGGQIYTSTDSGANWTPRESDRFWFSIASSADGTKLAAVTHNNGAVFTSSDSGVTWTERASFRLLRSITSSADGTRLAVVTDEYDAADHGKIYTSTDSGVTWVTHESSLKWYSIASSADGNKLAAVAWGDRIYTSSASTASYKLTVAEDSGTYTESAFATGITPGVGDVGQTVSLQATNGNNALFSAQPVISADGTLTFTPAANAYGTATVTVIATDSTGLTSAPQSFVIEVTSVIDAPVLAAPTFSNVSAYSATMQGEILNATDAEYSGKAIMYAPTSANSTLEYYGAGAVTIPLDDAPFSATRLNLLASDTQYSVRTCAYGPAGMIYSEVATFTTLAGAPVIWDNTEGLSKSMVSGPSFSTSTSQAVGYKIKTGDQAVQLSTVTLGLNSSSSQTCALRLRLFEAGTDSLPFGEPLLVHQDAARNFGYAGVYATIPLSGWQLSANHSYVLMIDATEGSAVWRSFINYSAFNSPTGWTSNVVVIENYAGLNAYGAGAYPLAIQVTGTAVETPNHTHQELWRFANFGSYASENSGADDGDPDGDGMSNILEYALGLDPNASGVTPASLALNGANLEYTYTRSSAARENGITYQIEWSDTLEVGSWSTETVTQEIQSTQGALETVKASVPAGSGGKRFLRLRVGSVAGDL